MRDLSRLDMAFDQCHDAVFGNCSWDDALQSLAEAFGAESCVFKQCQGPVISGRPLQLESTEHRRFSDLWLERIEGARDPHIGLPAYQAPQDSICLIEHQVTSEEERRTAPYFNEIARPGERDWWACLCFDSLGSKWCLPLYRGASRGPFDFEEAAYLAAQTGRLRNIAHLNRAVETKMARSRIDTFDALRVPAALLDRTGKVLCHNAALESLLGADLTIRRGILGVSDHASRTALVTLLGRAASGSTDPIVLSRRGQP